MFGSRHRIVFATALLGCLGVLGALLLVGQPRPEGRAAAQVGPRDGASLERVQGEGARVVAEGEAEDPKAGQGVGSRSLFIYGVTVDRHLSKPVSATVSVEDSDLEVDTDSYGAFAIELASFPADRASLSLKVVASGFHARTVMVELSEGAVHDIGSITLDVIPAYSVTCTDSGGYPLVGARVYDSGSGDSFPGETDDQGQLLIAASQGQAVHCRAGDALSASRKVRGNEVRLALADCTGKLSLPEGGWNELRLIDEAGIAFSLQSDGVSSGSFSLPCGTYTIGLKSRYLGSDCSSDARSVTIQPDRIMSLRACAERVVEISVTSGGEVIKCIRIAPGARHPTRGVGFGNEMSMASARGHYIVPRSAIVPSEFVQISAPGCQDEIVPIGELLASVGARYVVDLRPAEVRGVRLRAPCSGHLYLCEEGPFRFVCALRTGSELQRFLWTGRGMSIRCFPSEASPVLASRSPEALQEAEIWEPVVSCPGAVRVTGAGELELRAVLGDGTMIRPRRVASSLLFEGMPPGSCLLAPKGLAGVVSVGSRQGRIGEFDSTSILGVEVIAGQTSEVNALAAWNRKVSHVGRLVSTGVPVQDLLVCPQYRGAPTDIIDADSCVAVSPAGRFQLEGRGVEVSSFAIAERGEPLGPVLGEFGPGQEEVLVRSARVSLLIEGCEARTAIVVVTSSQAPQLRLSRSGVPTGSWQGLGFLPIQMDTWTIRWRGKEHVVCRPLMDTGEINRVRVNCAGE